GLNGLKPLQKPKRLSELFLELKENKRAHWAPKTFETADKSWQSLEPHFGRKFAHEVTTVHIADYQQGKLAAKISPYSINRHMALIRALLRRANVWHLIRQDYKPIPVEEQSGTALNEQEERRLLEAAE